MQAARLSGFVLGRDRRPVKRNRVEVIGGPGNVGHVLQRRAAALARHHVEHLDAAAVRAEIGMLAVERQIECRIARGQRVRRRRLLQRCFDDVAGNLGDARVAVNRRAVGLQDVQRLLAGEAHADGFNHVERGGVNLSHILVGEDIELRRGLA